MQSILVAGENGESEFRLGARVQGKAGDVQGEFALEVIIHVDGNGIWIGDLAQGREGLVELKKCVFGRAHPV